MNETAKQFLVELARVIALAVVPFLLTWVGVLPPTWAVVATVLLRAIDRSLHEGGMLKKGLTRF